MLNKICTIIIIFHSLALHSCAQNRICRNVIIPDIDNSLTKYDEENLVEDTMQKTINLFFERGFSDSSIILVGNRILYRTRINTRQFIGVSDSSFQINYSEYTKAPKISIYLIEKKACVSFYPITGKRLAYINHFEKGWSVELSNLTREYR